MLRSYRIWSKKIKSIGQLKKRLKNFLFFFILKITKMHPPPFLPIRPVTGFMGGKVEVPPQTFPHFTHQKYQKYQNIFHIIIHPCIFFLFCLKLKESLFRGIQFVLYETNWVFVAKSDNLILIFLQPSVVDLRYFKLWILWLDLNLKVYNILLQRYKNSTLTQF